MLSLSDEAQEKRNKKEKLKIKSGFSK